jgi:hypothetical protein
MKSPKTNVSKPHLVEQFMLDMGDGAPKSLVFDAKTARVYGGDTFDD